MDLREFRCVVRIVDRVAKRALFAEEQIVALEGQCAEWKRIADELKAERDAAKQEAVSARQDAVTRAEADRKRITTTNVPSVVSMQKLCVCSKCRRVDELKAERDAERKAHDEYKERNREIFNGNQRLTAELAVIKDERDALRAECDDLRRVFSLVHGSLGIQQGEHIGNAIDALKKERDELATRLRQSIARGDFAEMRLATLAAELETERERHRQTAAVPQSVDIPRTHPVPCDPPEATHITPDGKATAQAAVTPQPGDMVRLVRVPTNDEYPHDSGQWEPNWGGIGDYMRVHYVGSNINGTRVVRAVFGLEWPLSCVEVVWPLSCVEVGW